MSYLKRRFLCWLYSICHIHGTTLSRAAMPGGMLRWCESCNREWLARRAAAITRLQQSISSPAAGSLTEEMNGTPPEKEK